VKHALFMIIERYKIGTNDDIHKEMDSALGNLLAFMGDTHE